MEALLIVVLGLVGITVLYKLIPCRNLGTKKPFIALLPKYKKSVKHSLSNADLEEKLAGFGFKKVKESESWQTFTRGSILGDISIKLAKVNVGLRKISDYEHEVTVQAGWVAAFDNGDHWKFTKELTEKIENA
ncbi:hypothetical protein KDX31_06815 [Amphritea atlantica]|uniref:Uncharacterized protein n=1 Tax=Amphritea atlantica TaxID=355243 RepID=A0ABY5GXP7_9GAMM|nr:hypothetical protein KDX31_06815 [Amphritea atlantica]